MDSVFSRPKFGQMPAGYVPGIGRGAVPFFTRSDIGSAASPGFMIKYCLYSPTLGTRGHEHDRDRGDYSDTLFDRWSGFPDSHKDKPDPEDDEADKMYADVDEYLDSRRKRHREKSVLELVAKKRKPTIASLFADAKEGLKTVTLGMLYVLTVDEWNSIPNAKPHAKKKVKQAKKVPITDRVLYQAATEGQIASTDQSSNSDAIGSVIYQQLDKVGGIRTAAPSVDPVGYLTEMNSMKVSSEEEIRDLKKLRALVKSLTDTNPTHAEGWLTAARVEEKDGKLAEARSLVMVGLTHCPESEDLWLEAARLAPVSEGREMLVKGTLAMPHSVKLWLALASKSGSDKLATLRQGLQINPESVRLWKEIVQLASPEDARMYLRKAVTCVPQSLELWLALAKLENYENAKAVLNKARKLMPAEFIIWVYAAKLEEANGNSENVSALISRGLRTLSKAAVPISRASWLQEAFTAELAGSPLTAKAIVSATLHTGLEELEKSTRWLEDSEAAVNAGCFQCAREVLTAATQAMPDCLPLWRGRISLERRTSSGLLDSVYAEATTSCAGDVGLWGEFADCKAKRGEHKEAIAVLRRAVEHHPTSLPLYLQLSRLYQLEGDFDQARTTLLQCDCGKAWKRAALLDLAEGKKDAAVDTLRQGLAKYPGYARLHLLLADLQDSPEGKRAVLENAISACGNTSAAVWEAAAALEESQQNPIKARYLLEKSRRRCSDPHIWLCSVHLEQRQQCGKAAQTLLTEALRRYPANGPLLAEGIRSEERPKRKAAIVDAMEKSPDSAEVRLEAALAFWEDRKMEKARLWFTKCMQVCGKWGDPAAYFYLFESQQSDDEAASLLASLSAGCYKHGRIWTQTDRTKSTAERIMQGAEIAEKEIIRQ